jgi:hypothetical protein
MGPGDEARPYRAAWLMASTGTTKRWKVTSAYSSSSHPRHMRDRSYWLPPGGIGNGLDAQTWAVLVDTDASQLILLLDELREAGIAAYAARVDRLGRRAAASTFRIWVDTWTHARAEDVVRTVLLRYRPGGP